MVFCCCRVCMPLVIFIFYSQVAKLPFVINDGKWHHICITWTTRDGVWEAYQDGTQRGNGENLAPYHPIKPQGVLVLGQEQVRCYSKGRGGLLGVVSAQEFAGKKVLSTTNRSILQVLL